MRQWKPIFIEKSKIPIWLSKLAPIEIEAIALFPFVFSRETCDEELRRHETIHFQQYLETFVFGFWVLYLWDYMFNRLNGLSGPEAYRATRAEVEAYENDQDVDYLQTRNRFEWIFTEDEDNPTRYA